MTDQQHCPQFTACMKRQVKDASTIGYLQSCLIGLKFRVDKETQVVIDQALVKIDADIREADAISGNSFCSR